MDIKELRKQLKWTQTEMADYLGVNYHTVGKWESGQIPSTLAQKMLLKLQQDFIDGVIPVNTPETPQNWYRRGLDRILEAIIKVKDRRL